MASNIHHQGAAGAASRLPAQLSLVTLRVPIEETRGLRGGPLPDQALVILDPQRGLIVDMIPCEDGHAQERSLFVELVEPFAPGQLWIADRNFCTTLVIHEAVAQKACFLVREHAGLTVQEAGRWRPAGRTDGGRLFEQPAKVADGYGNEVVVRRIRLVFDEPTADGTREIYLLTNLPPKVTAATVAELYGNRWSIERAFGELTLSLRGEIDTLGYLSFGALKPPLIGAFGTSRE